MEQKTEEKHSYMLFKKHGWDVILKNIIVSVFWFLNGCFVLFNGGGTQMSAFRVGGGGGWGHLVGVSNRLMNDIQCICVSVKEPY